MSTHQEWTTHALNSCNSTFNEARRHAPWSIITTRRQLAGRGRFNRQWFGEEGGLWVCYNVPIDENPHWGLLPLLAGVALIDSLRSYAIPGLRLRWPNDLLVGRAKLAGILVEKPAAHMASIGIGVNIANNTLALYGKTSDPPTRLADYCRPCPSVAEYRDALAAAIAHWHARFAADGMAALQAPLTEAVAGSRPVAVITDTHRHCGFFEGVDDTGSPLLRNAQGKSSRIEGISVNRMMELC